MYNKVVAVVGNNVKAVCTCSLSFLSSSRSEFRKDYHQRAVASGFFISIIASVLHTKVVHLHGWLGRKHRHQETPPVCRPALVKRLVKHLVQRWNKAKCISELTRHAHLGRFVFKLTGVNNEYHNAWRRSDRNPSIHPWRTYV